METLGKGRTPSKLWSTTLLVRINNFIWVFGGPAVKPGDPGDFTASGSNLEWLVGTDQVANQLSLLWSLKREKWLTGPKLPQGYDLPYGYGGCATTLNRQGFYNYQV